MCVSVCLSVCVSEFSPAGLLWPERTAGRVGEHGVRYLGNLSWFDFVVEILISLYNELTGDLPSLAEVFHSSIDVLCV